MKDIRAWLRLPALLTLIVAACGVASVTLGQEVSIRVPVATPLPVQLGRHVSMRRGELLTCHLLYPVYAEDRLVIPAGSILRGEVAALHADRGRRIRARLRGDFTPFHVPVVHFDQLVLPDGTVKRIVSNDAADGAPVLHLSPPVSEASRSFFSRQITQLKEGAKDMVALVTAPGRGDRLLQVLFRQLPYHPERIEAATTWTITLAQPLALEPSATAGKARIGPTIDPAIDPAATVPVSGEPSPASSPRTETPSEANSAWRLRAYLEQTISSADGKPGDTFEASVAEPIFAPDHTLAVPEGSVLVGTIITAKPARSFGRAGKLRFDFRELKLAGGPSEHVQGALAGVDARKSQQLQIDSENGVESKPQSRVIVPTALTLLAGRALDDDGNATANAAIGSNGFGIVGRVVGIVAGSRDLAAGIGFYAAGLSIYERWLVRGQNVSFVKNTRIEVTTIPAGNPLPAAGIERNPSGRH